MAKIKKTKTPKKIAWLVDSYCDDQEESFLDLVPAVTQEDAEALVKAVRTYAVVTHAQTVQTHLHYAKKLARMSLRAVEKDFARIMEYEDKIFCKCGRICRKNDSGLCEKCEDADEQAKIAAGTEET